ncbi:MAG TPA: hypothetical protein ACFYD5_04485 [Candidatus Tripitaka sp. YC43]
MERPRTDGIILIVVGVVLAFVAGFADVLGLGGPRYEFGWLQGLGTSLGALGIIAGVYLARFEGKYVTAAGIIMVILFLLWDRLGLGSPGFGCVHSIALFTGVAVSCVGIYSMRKGS